MDHSRLLLGWQLHRNTITGQEDGHGTPIFASRSSKDDQEPSTSFLSFHLPVWSCRHIWPLVETRVSEFDIIVNKHIIEVNSKCLASTIRGRDRTRLAYEVVKETVSKASELAKQMLSRVSREGRNQDKQKQLGFILHEERGGSKRGAASLWSKLIRQPPRWTLNIWRLQRSWTDKK